MQIFIKLHKNVKINAGRFQECPTPAAFYFELWRLVAFLVFRKHHKRETYDVALLVAIIDSAFPSLVCFVQNGDTNEIVSL